MSLGYFVTQKSITSPPNQNGLGKKIMDLENRLVAARGEREGGRGSRLGVSSDVSWKGCTMRSC